MTQVLVEHQEPLDSLGPKDQLEEWACQVTWMWTYAVCTWGWWDVCRVALLTRKTEGLLAMSLAYSLLSRMDSFWLTL